MRLVTKLDFVTLLRRSRSRGPSGRRGSGAARRWSRMSGGISASSRTAREIDEPVGRVPDECEARPGPGVELAGSDALVEHPLQEAGAGAPGACAPEPAKSRSPCNRRRTGGGSPQAGRGCARVGLDQALELVVRRIGRIGDVGNEGLEALEPASQRRRRPGRPSRESSGRRWRAAPAASAMPTTVTAFEPKRLR